jgi:hypothetical protein
MKRLDSKVKLISNSLGYSNYLFLIMGLLWEFSGRGELIDKSFKVLFFTGIGMSLLIVIFRRKISKFANIDGIYIVFMGQLLFSIVLYTLIILSFTKSK